MEGRQMWNLMGSLPKRTPKFSLCPLFNAILKCYYIANVQLLKLAKTGGMFLHSNETLLEETTMCPLNINLEDGT